MSCSVPGCRRNRGDDGEEEDYDQYLRTSREEGREEGQSERGSGEVGSDEEGEGRSERRTGDDDDDESNEGIVTPTVRRPGRRTHNLSIFDPPPSKFAAFSGKVRKSIKLLRKYWKIIRSDEYRWTLFKSILFFTFGLKLFRDIARNKSALFGLGDCPKPACPPTCPTIDKCKIRH